MTVGYGAYLEKKFKKEAKAEGRAEERKALTEKTAVKMLKDGRFSEEDVSEFANMPIEQVRRIKNTLKL